MTVHNVATESRPVVGASYGGGYEPALACTVSNYEDHTVSSPLPPSFGDVTVRNGDVSRALRNAMLLGVNHASEGPARKRIRAGDVVS